MRTRDLATDLGDGSRLEAVIAQLIGTIEDAYARAAHDPAAFPSVARDALEAARVHDRVDLSDLLAWLARGEGPLPPQDLASGFGEPPITLFANERWAIQLLAWCDGRTSVHEHDFAGAFTVLEGASVQRRFRFDSDDPAGAPLRLGELTLLDVELLPRGAVATIEAGSRLVHSVFHIERPTLSLVVRTEGGLLDGPQYDFWGPHVALDPAYAEPRAVRATQMLALLVRAGKAWLPYARELLSRATLHSTFRVVDLLVGLHDGAPLPADLAAVVTARRGERALAQMLASIAEGRWDHAVASRHRDSANEEHRFFFAVLLTAPHRAAVQELVRARWPGEDPRRRIRRWVAELVLAGGLAADPALIAYFDRAVRGLLEGEDPGATAAALRVLEVPAHAAPAIGDRETFLARLADGPLRALARERAG